MSNFKNSPTMDKIPDLRPIVIPALEHRMDGKLFTCLGNGLQKDGHPFDEHVKSYLPLLEPVLTKAGKVKVHQPQIRKQPKSYWMAQCVFRSLPQTGTVVELQQQLRSSDTGMNTGLKELEENLNLEFRIKNASARDEKWKLMETLEAKAEAHPKRFLVEHFSPRQGPPIVLKTHHRSELHQECENHNLAHVSVDAPRNPDGSRPDVDRWIVIGKDSSAVHEKIREISHEATRVRQHAEELRAERTMKLHEDLVSTADLSRKNTAWDVTGSWAISCPSMEEQWGENDSGCSLDIMVTVSDGKKQMAANFDFIAITGIFRFISPVPSERRTEKPQSSKSVAPTRVGIGRAGLSDKGVGENVADEEDEDDDEESFEEDGYDEDSESPTPEEFYLSMSDRPSPKYPTWNYRWRGEETGEGEIQLYSDEKLCSVTFGGPGGTKLVGVFDSDLTGRVEFTGIKTGQTAGGGDPDYEWHSFNEEAYERAREGRWH